MKEWRGTVDEAKQHFKNFTRSKIAVVTSEGRDPRLVIDSTASGLNPRSWFPERSECPTMAGIMRFIARYYSGDDGNSKEKLSAFTLDVKSAHKRIKLHPKEFGRQFIEAGGKLAYYHTCHFGGAWSAYWWSRTAACLMRLIHRIATWPSFLLLEWCREVYSHLFLVRQAYARLENSIVELCMLMIS